MVSERADSEGAPSITTTGEDGGVTPSFSCPVDPAQNLSDSYQRFLSQCSVFLATRMDPSQGDKEVMRGMELVFRGRRVLASKVFALELSLERVLPLKGTG